MQEFEIPGQTKRKVCPNHSMVPLEFELIPVKDGPTKLVTLRAQCFGECGLELTFGFKNPEPPAAEK